MNEPTKNHCSYVLMDGTHCPGEASEGLCYWHDPTISKEGDNVRERLEAWANSGRSMEGFFLKRAPLEGLRLVKAGAQGYNLSHADLYRADLRHAHLYKIDLHNSSLMKANCTEANLNCANLEDANLLGTIFGHTHVENVRWGDRVLQDRQAVQAAKDHDSQAASNFFCEAEEVYRNLRKLAEARGLFEHAGWFFFREMVTRRRRMPLFSSQRALSKMVDLFCGYGEKPTRVILFSLTMVFCCSLLYFVLGISGAGQPVLYQSSLGWAANLDSWVSCLYFSVVTFTTLGYGDLTPLGPTRLIAAFEAFTGAFTLALFVVVFVKKMTR